MLRVWIRCTCPGTTGCRHKGNGCILTNMKQRPNSRQPVAIRDAATVVVMRDGAGGNLEVLLLRRNDSLVFAGGADVFPGGSVAGDDGGAMPGLNVNGASLGDAAWRMAALRECFEEAGLLFDVRNITCDPRQVAIQRQALNAGEQSWPGVLKTLDVEVDLTSLVAFSQWTTPPGFPRRFATRFYALVAPEGQQARPDGQEMVAADWVTPTRALAEAGAGQRRLMIPTRATLEQLDGYANTAAALKGLSLGKADV